MKGFVFTLDVAIGINIVISMLALSYFFISSDRTGDIEGMMMRRVGSDIVTTLHYNGTLGTLNKTLIESSLNALLPENMNMSMKLHMQNITNTPVSCPQMLSEFFHSCFDATGTAQDGCPNPGPGFVKYPPEDQLGTEGGLALDPDANSATVRIGCNDRWAHKVSRRCQNDADFNDVIATFRLINTSNGVKVNLTRESIEAGHYDIITVSGSFGGQNVMLNVSTIIGENYSEANIICGEGSSESSSIQINQDLNESYYSGTWGFVKLLPDNKDVFVFVEYKAGFK